MSHQINDVVMPLDAARKAAQFFQTLSDPTRIRLVAALARAEWCVTDLTRALDMDQPAVSHQLKYLRDMGLVRWVKQGRHVYYQLNNAYVQQAMERYTEWLDAEPASAGH